MVIDAFVQGVSGRDFQEFLGREKPKTVATLLKISTEWADREDLARCRDNTSPRDNIESGSHSRRDSYRDESAIQAVPWIEDLPYPAPHGQMYMI